jgi:exonuclease III
MLKTSIREKLIIFLLILGFLGCIYPFHFKVYQYWARYAMQISLGYCFLGLIFLTLRRERLMLYTFGITGLLCAWLKVVSDGAMELPTRTNMPIIKLAHFNLSFIEQPTTFFHALRRANPDIISLQETSPIWNKMLKDSLRSVYPHTCQLANIGFYGISLYSKYRPMRCDTFYTEGQVPNLLLTFKDSIYSNRNIYIVCSYVAPPLYESAYRSMQRQLNQISEKVQQLRNHGAIITVGDYNVPSVANELVNFRSKARLSDSRRGFRPIQNDGSISLFEVPQDHILYSEHFQCVDFQTLSGMKGERLGILGVYQFKQDSAYVGKKD